MINRRLLFSFAKITLLCLFFISCRSAKYVDDQQALVTKIELDGISPELKESASAYISNEIRPNSPLNLTIYNLFNTKDGAYKTTNLRSVGEAPRLLDSALVDLSATQIQAYLKTKGYFEAEVTPQIQVRRKKARINFVTDLKTPYILRNVSYDIEDPAVRNIYEQQVLPTTQVKSSQKYDATNLYLERENVYNALRNRGYYQYVRQFMTVAVDTNQLDHQADLALQIQNREDSSAHRVYTIDSVYVKIVSPNEELKKPSSAQLDSARSIVYEDETQKFRLRSISRYMFVRSDDLYNQRDENLSYDRLYEMNTFRSIKISYTPVDSNKLNVQYELTPRSVMSNQIEGEFTFSSGMSGFNIGDTYSHRNIFGGAELLEVKMRYGVLFDPRLPGNLSQKIFNNDFQVGVNLVVPRLMVPFGVRSVGRYGLPRTTFSSSLQIFDQDNTYSNRYLINSLNYFWYQSENITHSYTPILLEYRLGRLNPTFAQNLIDEGYLLYVESNNREYFGLGSQYAYTLNAPKLLKKEDFNYLRLGVDVSGNILGLLSSTFDFKKNEAGERLLFNVPYLQYIKGEVDYRWYKHFGGNKQLVLRFNTGVAVPYGNNSSLLIFEKSFFAGGMNGIRAWQARTLGPGGYNREGLSESLRLNLRNLDQLGEVKIEGNAEYRFRLLNNFLGAKLNGATFVDMGNIWRLRPNELNPDGEFKADRFLSQIAIGTGFGLRIDMDYFVIRLDAGLKVKDPQFTGSDQWVIRHLFNSKSFRDDYYLTHKPDRYNFFQYNFGVGLPF
ncbi:hypothetical protein C4F49_13505 [Sphingobacterium sp. KB22]|uniref:Bacterial surface antigen (D15) domain-containing protein n=1 Tax=Sphingobacterium hungaricum TaxID=2082723 RepID=A0A928V110_9SPHI|nr:hypothetical protein [Sphingobacterium hungaricum]